jgi:3-oxoacyl-[acyl-carrier protein] reductase
MKLTGKRAIVTGSSRGIGAGIAQELAAQGAKVVINTQNEAGMNDALTLFLQTF